MTQPARHRELTELVYKDDLTDLYNRRYLRRYLNSALGDAQSPKLHSLLMMDVDHFKRINDTLGHKCGDAVLIHIANILRSSFRGSDTIVRYAGDEFIVVLPETDKDQAASLAERMRQRIVNSPFVYQVGQPPLTLNVSVGVASYPTDTKNVDELLEMADRALYQAKQKGRGRISLAGQHLASILTEHDLLRRFPCPTFIGRKKLLEELLQCLPSTAGLSTERPIQFVLLKGLPGVGKSRLLAELRDLALKAGLVARMITCGEDDSLLPYQCITRILDELLSRDPDTVEKLTDNLPDDGVFCLRRAMPHLPIKRDVSHVSLTAHQQRQIMLKTMIEFLENLGQIRPLVIIFDELQNVDLGSMTLALALRNRGVRQVTFIGALRPDMLQDAAQRQTPLGVFLSLVKAEQFFLEFDVPALSREETKEMISAILPGLPSSPRLEELIWSASGGNPLFVQAHLKSLIAQGQIAVRDGVVTLDLVAEPAVPRTVEEAVSTTLQALDPDTSNLVANAAVAGTAVELQLLRSLTGINEGHVQELVDKAQRAALITKNEEDDRINFASGTVRDVAYHSTDEEQRRKTHGQIGQYMEEKYKENPEEAAPQLAYHFARSNQSEKAAQYQTLLRNKTRSIFDPSENIPMAAKKVAQEIPPAEQVLTASSAAKIIPFVKTLLDAVGKIKVSPADEKLPRALSHQVRGALLPILANDNPLTIEATSDGFIANQLSIICPHGDNTHQLFKEMLLGHNTKSITFRLGVEPREIELLLCAFAHRVDVYVGFLWPVWLGENNIKNIYVTPEIKTARIIREGEGSPISFTAMRDQPTPPPIEEKPVESPTTLSQPPLGKEVTPPQGLTLSVTQFIKTPAAKITAKDVRESVLQAFENAMGSGDHGHIHTLVDALNSCLTDVSTEVRLYAITLVEAILTRCVLHRCIYLQDMLNGILSELLQRESDPRVYGRLARIAIDAVNYALQQKNYESVRRLVGAFIRTEVPGATARGIRAQQAMALQQLLNTGFFDLVVEDLASGDPQRVTAANFALGAFGPSIIPRAIRALGELESMRTRLAVLSILKMQVPVALTQLREHFQSVMEPSRLKRILSVIGELLPHSKEIILGALEHPSDEVAMEAVRAFSKLPPTTCGKELTQLLKHSRRVVRLEALRTIGDLRLIDAEPTVRAALYAGPEEWQREVCLTLGKLGSTESVPALCRLLTRKGFLGVFGGAKPAVRAAAAWALGQIGDIRALSALRTAAADRNPTVQAAAKLALQAITSVSQQPSNSSNAPKKE